MLYTVLLNKERIAQRKPVYQFFRSTFCVNSSTNSGIDSWQADVVKLEPLDRQYIFWSMSRKISIYTVHCKDKIPKFRNKFSQKRNIGVSVPISTFMPLCDLYIPTICLPNLLEEKSTVDRSWDYINRSQTHECWNWGWGRAVPRKGIHKWDFRCSVEGKGGCFRPIDRLDGSTKNIVCVFRKVTYNF